MSNRLAGRGAVVVLVLALAGCGGSGGSGSAGGGSPEGGSTLSATEFRTQARAICTAANSDLRSIGKKLEGSPSPAEAAAVVDRIVRRIEAEVADLDRLAPPPELAERVDALLASVRSGVAVVKKKGIEVYLSGDDPFTEADQQARDLGLEVCSG